MNALIGNTGLVGFNLRNQFSFDDEYNSKNIAEIIGKKYDMVVCCGLYANKWYINNNPTEDLNNIVKLKNYLSQCQIKRFILISTIDVYSITDNMMDESYYFTESDNIHPYGKHRRLFEEYVKETYEKYNIVRLPGLFGFGLKKNIIYDMIYDNCIDMINLNTSYQWYYLGNLWMDILDTVKKDICIINLFPEPVDSIEIYNIVKKYKYIHIERNKPKGFCYNLCTMHSDSRYFYDGNQVIHYLEHYISSMLNNRLGISTLSWEKNNIDDYRTVIKNFGISSLEIAPYSYFNSDPDYLDKNLSTEIKISSIQAILYPMALNIFDDTSKLKDYMKKLVDKLSIVGVHTYVFGSPKNRYIKSPYDYQIAVDFFKEIGDYYADRNCVICIEPNAKIYGCNFIINSQEGRKLVLDVNSPGFKLHLDTGCMILENENIINSLKYNLDILHHVHISAPQLQLIKPDEYVDIIKFLKEKYKHRYVIEMLKQKNDSVIKVIYKCMSII